MAYIICPKCHERNPENRTACFRCGTDLREAPQPLDDTPEPRAAEVPQAASAQSERYVTLRWPVICPKCNQENPAGSLSCSKCGAILTEVVPSSVKVAVPERTDTQAQKGSGSQTRYVADSGRQRGGCLSAWLVLVMGANGLGALLVLGQAAQSASAADTCLVLALSIGNVVFAAALWNWKKWGAYGLAASFALVFLLGLALNDLGVILPAVGPAFFLLVLVGPKWGLME